MGYHSLEYCLDWIHQGFRERQRQLTLHAPDLPYAPCSRATFAWSSSFGARAPLVASGQRVMFPLGHLSSITMLGIPLASNHYTIEDSSVSLKLIFPSRKNWLVIFVYVSMFIYIVGQLFLWIINRTTKQAKDPIFLLMSFSVSYHPPQAPETTLHTFCPSACIVFVQFAWVAHLQPTRVFLQIAQ